MHLKTQLVILFISLFPSVFGQNTVGLINYESGNTDGFVLFSPMTATSTYLIDKCGEKVHEWNGSAYRPALSTFLLSDGTLLRTGNLNNPVFDEGGSGGIIEKYDWNGGLIWNYSISDSVNCLHHDINPLPNGNILCIVWDGYTKQEAVANGKDMTYNQLTLWSEKIVELKPVGEDSAEVIWEWKLFDHLIQDYDSTKPNYGAVADHPELVDINYFPGAQNTPDWIHLNSIDYNSELDQVLVSSHRMCEVWIIDHSTTTSEASSHAGGDSGKGGDLLYRWGNPQAYKTGDPNTKVFYGQHHATWIPSNYPDEGKIIVFNNGLGRPGDYSSIDIIDPPLNASNNYDIIPSTAFLPSNVDWSYVANNPTDFYSSNISGVYPLENGSFLISNGTKGSFFEINSTQQKVWEYVNPVNSTGSISQGNLASGNLVFRSNFYPVNYPGVQGQVLVPLGEIEQNPTQPSICETLELGESESVLSSFSVFPNPFEYEINVACSNDERINFTLYNAFGQMVFSQDFIGKMTTDTEWLAQGVYFYELSNGMGIVSMGKILK